MLAKSSCRKESKNSRTDASYPTARHEYRSAQDIGIDLVQHKTVLRNSTPVDHAMDRGTVFAHLRRYAGLDQ
jgi:hypothetical protein